MVSALRIKHRVDSEAPLPSQALPPSHAFSFPLSHLLLPTSGPLNMLLLLPGMQCALLSSFPPPLLLDESHLSFKSQHGSCHREPSQCPRLYQASIPDPPPHTSMALTSGLTAVIICVLVCLPYQTIKLCERWDGLVFTAVSPRPSLLHNKHLLNE